MTILLEKYRQHRGLEIDLPETGMVLIEGPSGSGKSTILDAIVELLYGDTSEAVPFGSSDARVEGDIFGLSIVRTRGPVTATLRVDSHVLKDEAANKEIANRLGMLSHEFIASSYIRQDMEGSLLSLGPADQLRFIQSLGCNGADPGEDQEKISKKINEKLLLVSSSRSKYDIARSALAEAEEVERTAKSNISEKPRPWTPEHEKAGELVKELDGKISALTAEIASIKRDLSQADVNKIKELSANMDALKLKKADILDSISKLEQESKELQGRIREYDRTGFAANLITLASKRQYCEIIREAKVATQKIADRRGLGKTPVIAALNQLKDEYIREQEALKDKLSDINLQIHNAKSASPSPCPNCGAILSPTDKGLILAPDSLKDKESIEKEINRLSDILSKTKAEAKDLSLKIESINGDLKEAEIIKARLAGVKDPMPELKTLDAVDEEEARWTDIKNSRDAAVTKLEVALSLLREAKEDLDRTEKEISNIEGKLALLNSKNVDALNALLGEKQALLNETIEAAAPIRKLAQEYVQLVSDAKLYKERYAIWESRHAALQKQLEHFRKVEAELYDASNAHAAMIRLKELSDKAAMEAIENIISDINSRAEPIIDRIFDGSGTTIRLKNTKTCADGTTRAKISLEIFHKGNQIKKLSSMSGGERRRAYLAFQLALSGVYKSPILMLDEPFAGIDAENKHRCMEILREESCNKLIVLIEHGISHGYFDQVINL